MWCIEFYNNSFIVFELSRICNLIEYFVKSCYNSYIRKLVYLWMGMNIGK